MVSGTEIFLEIVNDPHIHRHLGKMQSFYCGLYRHSMHTCRLGITAGEQFGLGYGDLKALGIAALLHDLGATQLPVEIYTKPGVLDEAEQREIRRHPDMSFEMMADAGYEKEGQIARCHHLHQKNPYPSIQADAKTWYLSQLLAMADKYQALRSRRPYKDPLGRQAAETALRQELTMEPTHLNHFLERIQHVGPIV